jgi:hypothetical protein
MCKRERLLTAEFVFHGKNAASDAKIEVNVPIGFVTNVAELE